MSPVHSMYCAFWEGVGVVFSGFEEEGGALGCVELFGGVEVSGGVEVFGGELESSEGGLLEELSPELSLELPEPFEEESSGLPKELSVFISLEFGGVVSFAAQAKFGNKNPSARHNARKEWERFIM